MTTVPLSEAKDRLAALVDAAERTHGIITRHGRPAAVLMAAEDLESLHETVFWLSRSTTETAIAEAEAALESGNTTSGEELRAEFAGNRSARHR